MSSKEYKTEKASNNFLPVWQKAIFGEFSLNDKDSVKNGNKSLKNESTCKKLIIDNKKYYLNFKFFLEKKMNNYHL